MRGRTDNQNSLFAFVNLEQMIPQDHLLRLIERHVDFSFIDSRLEGLYSSKGRPSIDPQVLVRMMLIGYLYGITSERKLCQEVHLNLAYRWFCGIGLEGEVPHHSTFSKNRHGRFAGKDVFRSLFYEVVDQAAAKGLIGGRHLSVDATLVRANAAMKSLEPIVVEYSKEQYLSRLDGEGNEKAEVVTGKNRRRHSTNDTHRSHSDPDSRVATRWGSKPTLSHSDNVLMDNEHGIVVEVEASPPSMRQEGLSCVAMTGRFQERTGSQIDSVGGDSAYARGEILGRMRGLGVKVYAPAPKGIPKPDPSLFGRESFQRNKDLDLDELVCPNGKHLRRVMDRSRPRMAKYVASAKHCGNCPLKTRCTRGAARTVALHLDQAAIDWAKKLRQSDEYFLSQRKRKRIEGLFGEAKELMGLRRARLRGHSGISEQFLMTAMAQNLKRIVCECERRLSEKANAALKIAIYSSESLTLKPLKRLYAVIKSICPNCFGAAKIETPKIWALI